MAGVRFGHSIRSPMKQQKSTFNSYNLFPAINPIQNLALFTVHLLRFQKHLDQRARICYKKWTKNVVSGVADQVAAVTLTECF